MNDKKLWEEYKNIDNSIGNKYDVWSFGASPDKLLDLVLKGEKTGTSSLYNLYEMENEPIPKKGDYSIILNSKNEACCIIQNIDIEVIPFCEVTKEHAFKEGEGDKSLEYWRNEHIIFFEDCLKDMKDKFSENTLVVYEEFKLVYRKKD